MARIRTIKPEFWTSEQVMECSPIARLLFIGLWNFCDDHGRHPLSPKQIKALVFPGDDITSENIRGLIDELSSNDLLTIYSIEDKEYFQITGWHHQKIDRRQSPKYPGPDGEVSEPVVDRSSNGIDGKGREKEKEKENAPPADAAASTPVDEERDLFIRGKSILGNNAGGLIAKVLKARGGSVPLARAVIETAATKQDPREYVGRVLAGHDPQSGQRERVAI